LTGKFPAFRDTLLNKQIGPTPEKFHFNNIIADGAGFYRGSFWRPSVKWDQPADP
jgi:hypothetical protein